METVNLAFKFIQSSDPSPEVIPGTDAASQTGDFMLSLGLILLVVFGIAFMSCIYISQRQFITAKHKASNQT